MWRRLESWALGIVVLVAVVACGGPGGLGGPSGDEVVVTDEPVVVSLPSGGSVTIPPLAAGESAVVTVAESELPFTGEFGPLEWLTSAVILTSGDDGEWPEDAVVQLSLPLTGSVALRAQAFEATNSVGVIRVAGAPDDVFGIPASVFYAKPTLNTSTGFVDMDLPAGLMLSSSSINARDVEIRIAGNVIEWRKTFWPAEEGLFRVVPAEVPLERDEFVDECGLNNLDDLLTKDLRGGRDTAVIMVHGWQTLNQAGSGGDNINHLVHCKNWIDVMAAFYRQAGDWQDLRDHADLFTFRYNSDKRIIESGDKLKNAVEELRALGYGTVVLLGHSMGGLVSVEARQQLEYPAYLPGIVTLGTPFMGGVIGCVAQSTLVVVPDPDVVGPSPDAETFCTRLIAPEALVTGVLDFIVPAGGSFDLTQYKPMALRFNLGNPYLERLWDGEGNRNFENIAAIYGDSSLSSMSATEGMKAALTASRLWFGTGDGAVPAFSGVASLEGRQLGVDPLPNTELTYRPPVPVGRDHGQLLSGCTSCANGRQGNENAYDPYFDAIADALLEFVPIVGAEVGTLTWEIPFDESEYGWFKTAAAVGSNGVIYFKSAAHKLIALDSEGVVLWEYAVAPSGGSGNDSTPVIAPDGTIYATSTREVHAVTADGEQLWVFPFDSSGSGHYYPVLGQDGTIYLAPTGRARFYAINPDGSVKWVVERDNGSFNSVHALARDGTIYTGCERALCAFSPDGDLRWQVPVGGYLNASSLALGQDGTVYAVPNGSRSMLVAIDPAGDVKWQFEMPYREFVLPSHPVVGSDGVIYVGSATGMFYAVNDDGTLRWQSEVSNRGPMWPSVGEDGSVYVTATRSGSVNGFYGVINAFDSAGNIVWRDEVFGSSFGPPALGDDGVMYVGDLQRIRAYQTASLGYLDSPWPTFQGDNSNSGRAR